MRIPFFNTTAEDEPVLGDETTAPPIPEAGGHHETRFEDLDMPERFRRTADDPVEQ